MLFICQFEKVFGKLSWPADTKDDTDNTERGDRAVKMPGGVRSRQPWLYLGADWAASDILGPEREAGILGEEGEGKGGGRRRL